MMRNAQCSAMNEFAEAFQDLQNNFDESIGKPQFAIIKGKKVRAVIEELTADEIAIAGGTAEAGGFRIHVPKASFSSRPQKGWPVKVNGMNLHILGPEAIERNDATYEINVGDPARDAQ